MKQKAIEISNYIHLFALSDIQTSFIKRKLSLLEGYNSTWKQTSWQVRDEANHCCTNCGHKDVPYSCRRLEVHHIDRNKRNDARENLVALCLKCHREYQNYNLAQMAFDEPIWVTKHREDMKRRGLWKAEKSYIEVQEIQYWKLENPILEF